MEIKLEQLLKILPEKQVFGDENPDIKGVVYDPLRIEKGFLYVAINIYTQMDKIELPDGHPLIPDAIKAGAVAVIVEKNVEVQEGIVKIIVPDSRLALALVAGEFYQHPSLAFKLIGITGTNGKTTTAHIVESILAQKYRTGLIGTLYYKINGKINKSKDTTPEPPDLQEIFTRMKDESVEYCVMEVSSHGVDFHRVSGVDYETGIWTNFTQDHLDWHKTMEAYRAAKLRWFGSLGADKTVVVNVDDVSSQFFIDAAQAKIVKYGIENSADVSAENINMDGTGTSFTLVTPKGKIDVHAKLRGMFNLYNMLAAVSAVLEDVSLAEIKTGLEQNIVVAGRFQTINQGQDFTVIVDYAHTPDGLLKVLNAARSMNPNRIITVFGCGGDRDPDKRPKMAAITEELSDIAIITDDNPRTEDPKKIVEQVVAGIKGRDSFEYKIIHDRHKAIEYGIDIAQTGDLVLIAGKGHETTQTLKDRTIHFNDVEVADEILKEKLIK
ncbi:UDP-N-acetylmuramoyl-L-alanyl-D-glutamate--2,6-diaminopimelate ligase [bacterium]|nr:UDP-N-acetylmuramoyl-L-alanyl-D-glutamate--2,6-diaminopimelate ligase [bacterium]